jgi:hypothetical protein
MDDGQGDVRDPTSHSDGPSGGGGSRRPRVLDAAHGDLVASGIRSGRIDAVPRRYGDTESRPVLARCDPTTKSATSSTARRQPLSLSTLIPRNHPRCGSVLSGKSRTWRCLRQDGANAQTRCRGRDHGVLFVTALALSGGVRFSTGTGGEAIAPDWVTSLPRRVLPSGGVLPNDAHTCSISL